MKVIKQWPVFFLLSAFVIAPLFQGGQMGIIVAIHALILTVFIKVFLASYKKFRIPYNFLCLSILLFYLWMALSIAWSPAPSISIHMFVWLSIFPLCYLIYTLKQPDDWPYLPIGILCITLLFALIGISQEFIIKSVPSSFFLDRNTFAGMLNLTAQPTAAWFIISVKKRKKYLAIFLGIALFILFFAIFQTASRGAAISLLFGLFFIVLISLKYIEKSLFLRVFVILIIAFLFADHETTGRDHNIVKRIHKLSEREHLYYNKLVIWESGWQIIKTAPIIGTGIGTFFIVYPPVQHPNDESSGDFLHNDYLQFWLETGLIGLGLMMLVMVAIIIIFVRTFRYKNLTLQNRMEATGLMAGLLVTALHSFVYFHFYIIAILMVMGFICARIQEIAEYCFSGVIRDFVPAHKLSKNIFILAAVVLPVVILSYSLPMAIGNFYMNKANEYLENGQIKNAELTLKRAALWNPGSITIRFQQFSLYRNILQTVKNDYLPNVSKDLFAKALFILNKIESINPLMGAISENRGYLLIDNTDIVVDDWEEKAIFEFKKALQLNPRLYRSRVALARLLEQKGMLNEAVLLMNDGIPYQYYIYLTSEKQVLNTGLNEFYEHAIRLNLMSGDTAKAKYVHQKMNFPDSLHSLRINQ